MFAEPSAPVKLLPKVVEERIRYGCYEQGQQQAKGLSTNDNDRHGAAFLGARTRSSSEWQHAGDEGERRHKNGAEPVAIGLHDGRKPLEALRSEVIHVV